MSTNKQTRKEIMENEARINELERAKPYLQKEFFERRKTQLLQRNEDIQDKLEKKELAPDIQYIISECKE